MPKNPFVKGDERDPKLKRNSFDLSFQNNLTLPFGKLVPVFCKEVIPGDSFRINSSMGFNLDPTVYPVQTRINARLHFFYVRNRALWKNWKDFLFKTKDNLVFPYIQGTTLQKPNMYRTGSLGDYLGLPTSGTVGLVNSASPLTFLSPSVDNNLPIIEETENGYSHPLTPENFSIYKEDYGVTQLPTLVARSSSLLGDTYANFVGKHSSSSCYGVGFAPMGGSKNDFKDFIFSSTTEGVTTFHLLIWIPLNSNDTIANTTLSNYSVAVGTFDVNNLSDLKPLVATNLGGSASIICTSVTTDVPTISSVTKGVNNVAITLSSSSLSILQAFCNALNESNSYIAFSCPLTASTTSSEFKVYGFQIQNSYTSVAQYCYNDTVQYNVPTSKLHISALPFRAYESIYNSFYRNQQNDPFVISGENEYNKFITTDEDGSDTTVYKLFDANWEQDFLTSALQTPQQGAAPLVGVNSATGTFTFVDGEGNTSTLQAVVGDDGQTLTGIDLQSSTVPSGAVQALQTAINQGISINDFRNVNSLQRWLETNIRKGYKYKDLIAAHFGVNVHYNELDMPEFIGGISQPIEMQKIINQNAVDIATPLGEYAGLPSLFAKSDNDITKYCDEHGYIIGILSVVPVPVYGELLPKHFIKNNQLDYFTPEFSKIGLQPILYNEVSPLTRYLEHESLTDVFGYQKAWYDYMQSTDEVHGDFRTTFRDYVMMRRFEGSPQLGAAFLHVDENQLNDVFAVTTNSDKIKGMLYFNVFAKRPIPTNAIPALE